MDPISNSKLGDGHYFEGTTTERWGVTLDEIKNVLKRAISATDALCVAA